MADGADGAGENGVSELQEILESMLSKHNLVADAYLAGSMNAQMYIPVSVLLAHEKLSAIATQEKLLAAARNSARTAVSEDETMIRPMLKSKRNTIILRDMPEATTEAEIREIFAESEFGSWIKSVKADVNCTWFVKFSGDDTISIVMWLRSRKFRGEPINAAIKSEHFLRSFFPVAPPPQELDPAMQGHMGGPPMPMGPPMMFPPVQPAGYWQPWGTRTELGHRMPLDFGTSFDFGGSVSSGKGWPSAKGGWGGDEKGGYGGGKGWGKGEPKGGGGWGKGDFKGDFKGWGKGDAKGDSKGGKERRQRQGKGDGRKGERSRAGREGGSKPSRPAATPKVDEDNFPSLPGASRKESGSKDTEPGYVGEFRRYTREEFEKICEAVDVSARPDIGCDDVMLDDPCRAWTPPTTAASYKAAAWHAVR